MTEGFDASMTGSPPSSSIGGGSHLNAANSQQPDLSFCILWSPLHPITAFFPFIGHLGISDSRGRAHDFQGPYTIGIDGSTPLPAMAFGPPTRYLRLDVGGGGGRGGDDDDGGPDCDRGAAERWDEALREADEIYRGRMHNLFCDNCHSHVARALNIVEYGGRHDWNMVKLCFWVFVRGSFVDHRGAILIQFAPFLVLVALYFLFGRVL